MDKKDKDTEIQRKRCFIITPIGETNSEIFRKAKGVIDSVIKPVLRLHGFEDIKPAYEIIESGMIGNQIIDRIVNDDLVVANLTGNNPNVMYELAIRHATAKPIIHICEKGTVLPFDIKDNRTAFFSDDMLGVQELQKEFEKYVIGLSYDREYRDNPIYNGIQMTNLLDNMNIEGRKTEAELLQKILDIVSVQHQEDGVRNKQTSKLDKDNVESMIRIKVIKCATENYNKMEYNLMEKISNEGLALIKKDSSSYIFVNPNNKDFDSIQSIVKAVAIENEAKLICESGIFINRVP